MKAGHLFISHSSKDAYLANQLLAALESRSLACWISHREIRLGDNYAEAIVEAVGESAALIVVLTRSALKSGNVQREVGLSLKFGIPLLPLIVDEEAVAGVEAMPQWQYWLHTAQFIQWTSPMTVADEVVAALPKTGDRSVFSDGYPPASKQRTTAQVFSSDAVDIVGTAIQRGNVRQALQQSADLLGSPGNDVCSAGRRVFLLCRHAALLELMNSLRSSGRVVDDVRSIVETLPLEPRRTAMEQLGEGIKLAIDMGACEVAADCYTLLGMPANTGAKAFPLKEQARLGYRYTRVLGYVPRVTARYAATLVKLMNSQETLRETGRSTEIATELMNVVEHVDETDVMVASLEGLAATVAAGMKDDKVILRASHVLSSRMMKMLDPADFSAGLPVLQRLVDVCCRLVAADAPLSALRPLVEMGLQIPDCLTGMSSDADVGMELDRLLIAIVSKTGEQSCGLKISRARIRLWQSLVALEPSNDATKRAFVGAVHAVAKHHRRSGDNAEYLRVMALLCN